MKLGVFTALFGQQSLDETLDYIKRIGVSGPILTPAIFSGRV